MKPTIESPIELLFVLNAGTLILDWAGPAEAFRSANLEAGEPSPFKLRFIGPAAQLQSSVGAWISAIEPLPAVLPPRCWLILLGQTCSVEHADDGSYGDAIVDWLRQCTLQPGQRLLSVCTGALLAARAGLLDGHRVTTHHFYLDVLAELAPKAQVVADRVFVDDGQVCSSAGVSTGIDLALYLISEQCGPLLAAQVAQRMVLALRRGPNDPQLSPFLAHRQHLNLRLHRVQDAVARAPQEAWDAQRMADQAHITVRTLNRLFSQHTGITPLIYLRELRLALARAMLDAGGSVAAAAEAAGFSSDLQLRRAWQAGGLTGSPSAERRHGHQTGTDRP